MAMSEQDIRHRLGEMNRAYNNHQLEEYLSYYTDDAVYEDEAAGKMYRGKDEIRRFFRDRFDAFNDLMYRMDNQVICDETAVMEALTTGTNTGNYAGAPPTGRHMQVRYLNVLEFAGGEVQHYRAYHDRLTVADQLGAVQRIKPHPQMQPWEMGPASQTRM